MSSSDGYVYTPFITKNGVRIYKAGGGLFKFRADPNYKKKSPKQIPKTKKKFKKPKN